MILLSALIALGYLVVIIKMFGLGRAIYIQVPLDVFFTFGLPLVFIGTFQGMVVAALAGLWFSGYMIVLSLFFNPKPLLQKK
jgi:hypothetical protein